MHQKCAKRHNSRQKSAVAFQKNGKDACIIQKNKGERKEREREKDSLEGIRRAQQLNDFEEMKLSMEGFHDELKGSNRWENGRC